MRRACRRALTSLLEVLAARSAITADTALTLVRTFPFVCSSRAIAARAPSPQAPGLREIRPECSQMGVRAVETRSEPKCPQRAQHAGSCCGC